MLHRVAFARCVLSLRGPLLGSAGTAAVAMTPITTPTSSSTAPVSTANNTAAFPLPSLLPPPMPLVGRMPISVASMGVALRAAPTASVLPTPIAPTAGLLVSPPPPFPLSSNNGLTAAHNNPSLRGTVPPSPLNATMAMLETLVIKKTTPPATPPATPSPPRDALTERHVNPCNDDFNDSRHAPLATSSPAAPAPTTTPSLTQSTFVSPAAVLASLLDPLLTSADGKLKQVAVSLEEAEAEENGVAGAEDLSTSVDRNFTTTFVSPAAVLASLLDPLLSSADGKLKQVPVSLEEAEAEEGDDSWTSARKMHATRPSTFVSPAAVLASLLDPLLSSADRKLKQVAVSAEEPALE